GVPIPGSTVRPATAADIPALERILSETFLADHTRFIPEPIDPQSVRAFSRDLVARRWPAMALAELDGESIGMAYVEDAKIEAVNVLPAFQGRGAGSALRDWAEARIAAAGFAEASVDTQEANVPARSFYEARGYTLQRRWLQPAFTRTPIPTVTLARRSA